MVNAGAGVVSVIPHIKNPSPFRRRALLERLEDRLALDAGASVMPTEPIQYDLNSDQHVSPVDVLIVVNELNRLAADSLPADVGIYSDFAYDTNADGFVTPLDAKVIIDVLNANSTIASEVKSSLLSPEGENTVALGDQ